MAEVICFRLWLRTAVIAAVSFGIVSAEATVTFPVDLFDVKQLSEQIRGPIGLKLRDLRKTFGTKAHSGTKVDLIDSKENVQTRVEYLRSLNKEKTRRTEETRLHSNKDELLVTERILTLGTGLEYSDPATRAYLDGSADYGLSEKETSKTVDLQFGDSQTFRFVSTRSGDRSTVNTQVFYGGTMVLSMTDKSEQNGTVRVLDYSLPGGSFTLEAFGSRSRSSYEGGHCRVIGTQTLIGPDLKMTCNGNPIQTYGEFIQILNSVIYRLLFVNSAQPLVAGVIKNKFPDVQRPVNPAATGRMYTDILNIIQLLEPHQGTPNVPQILNTLRQYISWIQDGTVEIKDSR